jgi:hypothetical protein
MIGISIANSLGLNKLSGINPDAAAFIAAAGITGTTQVDAVNNLVNGLQADGLWSKMKAVYPFVTDNINLASYTEDFSNANWLKTSTTVTANSTTAPNGTSTADTINFSTNSSYINLFTNGTNSTNGVYSVYLKASSNTQVYILTNDGIAFGTGVQLLCNVTTEWQRFIVNGAGSNVNAYKVIAIGTVNPTTGGSGVSATQIFAWGAQLELGSTATTYQPIATTQQAYIASQFKYNLVNPVDSDAAFRLVFNGGWTHSSTGATPNGTNGYANTKVFNNTNLTDRASHWSAYLRTINANDGYFGYFNNFNVFGLQQRNNLNRLLLGVNSILTTGINSTNGYLIGKTDSTLGKVYVNNTQSETQVANVISGNLEFFLGGLNNNGSGAFLYSQHQYAFSTLGDKLSDTEASNLYTRVQNFQTALSRNV